MMDARSEANLAHVHPDLVKIMRAAAQAPQAFIVSYGIRTLAAERAAVASGHSQTTHSRHLPQRRYARPGDPDGLACAVDTAALIGGEVSFAPGHEEQVFGAINAQVQAAACALGIEVQWGGAPLGAWTPGVVSHFRDWGHFQLRWDQYPA